MAISMAHFWKIIRDGNRAAYERDIAAGKTKRLPQELEKALFEYQNDQVLTLGGKITKADIDAKAEECAKDAGLTTAEFKELFVTHRVDPK
jgi:hypothetical protein